MLKPEQRLDTLDSNNGTLIVMYKTSSRIRMFTKQRVCLIFKDGADRVAVGEQSKFSFIESKVGGVNAVLCARMDPAVGV